MRKKLFSIVLPIYKNELNLPRTVPYILECIPTVFKDYDVEIVMVNDGSPDRSWEIMKTYQAEYPETIRIVRFVRNYGQPIAIRCGVSQARGDVIGVISADLQDPLELFVEMIADIERGHDLVCGVRASRDEKGMSVLFSKAIHLLINRFINHQYPKGGFDFFVISREAAQRWLSIGERNGSMQLQLLSIGANVSFVPYNRRERDTGKSGWSLAKKVKYFIDTFTSHSYLPLRMMSVGGFCCAGGSFVYASVVFFVALLGEREVPGWSSLALLITFFSGLILLALGIVGEYLWRIYDEVKRKPLYFIEEVLPENGECQLSANELQMKER